MSRRTQGTRRTLGTQQADPASSSKATPIIGLIVPDLSHAFFATIARHVEHCARERGYGLLICDSHGNADTELEAVHSMLARRVSGLVIAPVGQTDAHFREIIKQGTPLVFVDRIFPKLPASAVTCDNFEGARQAVLHLAEHGHRQIACLQGLAKTYANAERVRGFRAGLTEAGLHFASTLIAGQDYTIESGKAATLGLFGRRSRPTAVLTLGNSIALGALQALKDLRIRVPESISIISFDDRPWASLLSPALTTIAQPVDDLGRQASQLLFDEIKCGKPAEPKRIVLPVTLIPRESVGQAPAE